MKVTELIHCTPDSPKSGSGVLQIHQKIWIWSTPDLKNLEIWSSYRTKLKSRVLQIHIFWLIWSTPDTQKMWIWSTPDSPKNVDLEYSRFTKFWNREYSRFTKFWNLEYSRFDIWSSHFHVDTQIIGQVHSVTILNIWKWEI